MSREEQKLSGAMRLFEALSGVDEDLWAKAEGDTQEVPANKKKKKFVFPQRKIRLAASLAAAAASVLLVVGTVWTGMPMMNGKKSAETAVMTMEDRGTVTADSAANDTEGLVEEAAEEDTKTEEKVVGGTLAENAAGSSAGKYSSVETESQKEIGQNDTGENANLETVRNEELTVEKGAVTDVSDGVKPDDRVALTEAQARAVELLGSYIPARLPKGYVWESAKATVVAETGAYESIFLCWTRGMDSIMITVSLADPGSVTIADITKKESYDVNLYEIPYAETVPEEYRQIFDNPVFAAEDLSQELVEARMKAVADSGATDTPRGRFAIIYPEGILLEFNGDGTAVEIWEMLR